VDGFKHAEPGLAIKYRTKDGGENKEATEKLFSFLSTIFSVAIFE
jgi:hypothetical protein